MAPPAAGCPLPSPMPIIAWWASWLPRLCSPNFQRLPKMIKARTPPRRWCRRRPSWSSTTRANPRQETIRRRAMSPSDFLVIPFDEWVTAFVRGWLVPNFRPFFRAVQVPITQVLNGLDALFAFVPMLATTAAFALLSLKFASRGMAIFTIAGFIFIDLIGLWPQTMTTLAMIVTSVLFCAVIGIPLGILAARNEIAWKALRPTLDVMQTIPSFVYLVPIVMLFGVGMAPGIIATVIFALPPIVRLTNPGISNVPADLIEAPEAFPL